MTYKEILEETKSQYQAWQPWLNPQELAAKAGKAAKERFARKNKRTLSKRYVSSSPTHNRYSGKPDVEIYDERGILDADESLRLENELKKFWSSDWNKVISFCEQNNLQLVAGNAAGKYTD